MGEIISLAGKWNCKLSDGAEAELLLPGSLDENQIGYKDIGNNQWHPDAGLGNATEQFDANAPIATRFTRKYTYEGIAEITKKINIKKCDDKRYFVYIERARELSLKVNGKYAEVFEEGTISTPWVFEITHIVKNGQNIFTFESDNSYKTWPKKDILFSSAATDETQTNWNGLLGRLEIIEKNDTFIKHVLIHKINNKYEIEAIIDGPSKNECTIKFYGDYVNEHHIKDDIPLWDIYEGKLSKIKCELYKDGNLIDYTEVEYGIRKFASIDGQLALNDRKIFLRGETNSAVYPETGYLPMTVDEWIAIFQKYISYGVNFVRFHSHCPPEAAFTAADRLGIMLQPELSNWNPKDAFSTSESKTYYEIELKKILEFYNRHPSFVMFSLGNELWADKSGHNFMEYLLNSAREIDNSRMYTNASNAHYGNIGCDLGSDFYEAQSWYGYSFRGTSAGEPTEYNGYSKDSKEPIPIQGFINNKYPDGKSNYTESINALRKEYSKPVVGFETGQYEMLPDFDELEDFRGISEPNNYRIIRQRAVDNGLIKDWKKYVEATGELALLAYKEEVEAALRTPGFSGTLLLSLQDFPGQGTALVGMMNSHLKVKPYSFADPKRFAAFFKAQHIMLLLDKYTYYAGEDLIADLQIANYGKNTVGKRTNVRLYDTQENVIKEVSVNINEVKVGETKIVGRIQLELPKSGMNKKYILKITSGKLENEYPIWCYERSAEKKGDVYFTTELDSKTLGVLKKGGKVFLEPVLDKKHLPNSIGTQFTTDFWSVGTFSRQEGGMGQLIDNKHPVFKDFPTEFHTNWQWFKMAVSRAVILPAHIKPIITEIDSYAYMRHMAQLFELNYCGGKIMISTMGLNQNKEYPEVQALLNSIYNYMNSIDFNPRQTITEHEMQEIIG
ncbi:MAG: hypothetical protein E7273_06350 [Pseudobutyrivibrio ruminis]|nr:hypothetical protein [Pseudobutyrivibrio ruminis]